MDQTAAEQNGLQRLNVEVAGEGEAQQTLHAQPEPVAALTNCQDLVSAATQRHVAPDNSFLNPGPTPPCAYEILDIRLIDVDLDRCQIRGNQGKGDKYAAAIPLALVKRSSATR